MSDEETKIEGEEKTCSCGSGKEEKDCCGATPTEEAPAEATPEIPQA